VDQATACKLVDKALQGREWLHEIKYDGYRMHARLDRGRAQLLTWTGLDWTHKYPAIAAAVSALPARQAYLDGELCGVRPDGKTSLSMIQTASDAGIADALVFFLFDLLYLDGDAISAAPLRVRKERLRQLLSDTSRPPHFSDHQIGCGLEFYANVCEMSLEGIISKRADAPYSPGDRRLWVKVKCENREEFMVVGWTDPEGAPVVGLGRSCWRITIRLGGSFMQGASGRVLTMRSSAGLGVTCTPRPFRDAPRSSSPSVQPVWFTLVLSRVHWVRPELIVEVKYLTWTGDNLLRRVVYQGLRQDKNPQEGRRDVPTALSPTASAPKESGSVRRKRGQQLPPN
jgi:ATP-dependent DNA ligase